MNRKIRTLIVDDSPFYRQILAELLGRIGNAEVVGSAADGREALRLAEQHTPDLVTLDVEMPGMTGVDVLKELKRTAPGSLAVMISTETQASAEFTIAALEAGALDFILKPGNSDPEANERQLYRELRRVVSIVDTKMILAGGKSRIALPERTTPIREHARQKRIGIVAIGVSTGGPAALPEVLARLPNPVPVPVVIVQHMPEMFVSVLAGTLNQRSANPVIEAVDDALIERGKVYLAPGGKHMRLERHGTAVRIRLTDDPPENFCRPAADYTFRSIVETYGGDCIAVIMTGMGRDGVKGITALKSAGAVTIAQDEDSCTVFGMPMEAIKAGVIDDVRPLNEIGSAIGALLPTYRAT